MVPVQCYLSLTSFFTSLVADAVAALSHTPFHSFAAQEKREEEEEKVLFVSSTLILLVTHALICLTCALSFTSIGRMYCVMSPLSAVNTVHLSLCVSLTLLSSLTRLLVESIKLRQIMEQIYQLL